jgi:cytochrome c553
MTPSSTLVAARLRRLTLGVALACGAAGAQAQDAPALVKAQCAVCHGERGESTNAQFPQLAGQNGQYIRKQLDDFREGRRTHEAMNGIARSLNASQVQALASYFEAQAPVAHPPTDALLAGVGRYIYERGNIHARVPACVSCHKESGRGNAHLPRLAGQHPQYVENQLRRFHAKDRRNDAGPMAFVTDGLTELELRAVAAYVGGMTVPITRR